MLWFSYLRLNQNLYELLVRVLVQADEHVEGRGAVWYEVAVYLVREDEVQEQLQETAQLFEDRGIPYVISNHIAPQYLNSFNCISYWQQQEEWPCKGSIICRRSTQKIDYIRKSYICILWKSIYSNFFYRVRKNLIDNNNINSTNSYVRSMQKEIHLSYSTSNICFEVITWFF